MEEYIVGPVLDKLIESLFEYVQDQFKWQTGMKKELESLRDNYPKIQAVVSTAKRAHTEDQNSALNKWIWQLRDAIDEADDLLDNFEYKKLEKPTIVHNIIKVGKRAIKIDPDLMKLEEVVRKLDIISAEVSTFHHLLDSRKHEQREQQAELHKTRQTGSLPKNDLIGRGKDLKFIIQWLRKPSNEEHQTHVTATTLYNNISLLSIVGHGGMGKTTLLQHVYQDEIMKEFDLKMWVCVSDSFDVNKVIKDMLECLENERTSLDSLHALQERLKSKVMSKKFLVVLDDIWDDKEEEVVLLSKLGDVLAPLASGDLGSKILITTRTDSTASMITKVIRKEKEAFILKGLEEDECLQLLITHAFVVGENPNDHENLKSIAGELVKKLYGSPLTAKVMGGVLNCSLDEGHWRNVLNNSLGLNGILPILKLSYIFLREHLQTCFSFCSIFEQDHVFKKDDLVHMWIAVGFIQPSHNNQGETLTLEDIGKRYFDVLFKKSFFEEDPEGYKMHDLLHELAQFVSTQECFKFVGDEKTLHLKIPETIRHLHVKTSNPKVLKKLGRFKNLRTLFITCNDEGLVDALNEMFKVTRSIRLLHVSSCYLRVIPNAIGYLLHLRYLAFYCPSVKLLPRCVGNLYHLQFTTFDIIRDMDFPRIKKITFLENLKGFCIKNEKDYKFEVLEHMNELRILRIYDLKDMRDAQEACKVKLCDKRKLMNLLLAWNHSEREVADRDLDERVLDNLQPHNYLKTLEILSYMGARSSIWMNEAHLINNLQDIYISHCLEWEILPPFGQLPFLKSLTLWEMPKVKRLENKFHGNDMCSVFPSLQMLYIWDMDALVDWFDASVVDGLFPCLTYLHLFNCPKLQELPYFPPQLETLDIHNIGWKTLSYSNISKSIPLRSLEVSFCENITSISLAGEICKLKKLRFEGLTSLQSLSSSLANIPSLEILELIDLPQLRELTDIPLSLKELYIFQCDPELMKRHEQFSSNC